jgi:hypothetical protein
MDLKPESFLNAELTLALQPPQVTPVMPATYVTSPAIAGTIAKAANAIVAISFFMICNVWEDNSSSVTISTLRTKPKLSSQKQP